MNASPEPTRDPAVIRAWADAGADLAVLLREMPADGPCHPSDLYLHAWGLELVCETTGRESRVIGNDRDQLDAVARTAAGWGCTYLVLREVAA